VIALLVSLILVSPAPHRFECGQVICPIDEECRCVSGNLLLERVVVIPEWDGLNGGDRLVTPEKWGAFPTETPAPETAQTGSCPAPAVPW
jgi:hypothetical protein